MKDYKESKKAKRSVLSKEKVIMIPAVEEVKDSKGKVIQAKVEESSYDVIKISTKAYNPLTGSKLADSVVEYSEADINANISSLESQIASLTAEKESWAEIIADYKAL
mgnify:CR=1 FL=1